MSYRAFISYNTSPEEQVVIYRLQTLASVSGITVLLPQRNGKMITGETKYRIDIADSVIALLTSNLTTPVREELAYAQEKGKLIIPIYEKGAKLSSWKSKFDWIEYDPQRDTPGDIEKRVFNLLRGKKKTKENQQAALLALLGVGLLALLASSER
jgi:hypothetical protein